MDQVFVDLTPLVTKSAQRGIGRYVRGLISGLSEVNFGRDAGVEVRGFSANPSVTRFDVVREPLEYVLRDSVLPVPYANYRRTWLVSLGLPLLDAPRDAIIHLAEPPGIPWLERRRYTITSHDLISLALPELYLPNIPRWSTVYAGIERVRFAKAKRILAVSRATKRDLIHFLGIPEDRIDVVWHGVAHERFHPRAEPGERERVTAAIGTDAPYVLYLGAGDARKDLDTLVAAFARPGSARDLHLVIAGHLDAPRARSLRTLSAQHSVASRVHLTGFVDERVVPALYRQSTVHVFPSRYEGFGLPVLEALACGAPTITSPGSSLDEVAADAAVVVPCGEVEALASALEGLLTDDQRRAALRDKGIERAAGFTWERCATETLAFWKRSKDD